MSHVAFVPFAGLRVKETALGQLGMSLPGLRRRAEALSELPSLGLLTLAGMTPGDWSCSYHESSVWDEELVATIVAEAPDLVAVSALTASIEEAYQFCDRIRECGLRVAIGGLHVTSCADEAKQHADAVVIGEGEPVWPTMLEDARHDRLRKVYRGTDAFDLSRSPIPRFDLIGSKPRMRMTLQTERGCPLACDFCGASRLLGKFREKPVDRIAAELTELVKVSPDPWLELADDNTFAGRRDSAELFDKLAAANARYFTEADWRIGEDAQILDGLAYSGCVQVLVGIESMIFRYPGMGAKQAELQRIMDAVDAIQEAGVVVNGCFIVGADGETNESLDRMSEFILNSPLAEIQLTLQTPFPGTALYDRLRGEGRLIAERGWPYYTLFDVTYQPDQMTVGELEAGFRRAMADVFSAEASAHRASLRKQIWREHPRFRK